jgi:Outer membrane protein beta-barrel domain
MTSGKRLAVAIGIALLTAFGSPAAQAQYAPRPYYPPPPPRGVYRSGVVVGFGIGGGSIIADNCSNCGGGGGFEVHLGGMLNPRLAVMGEIWGIGRPTDNGTLSNVLYGAAIQYWVADIVWLKGGLGGGTISFEDSITGQTDSESSLALTGAVGVEVVQSYNFALDIQLRVGHTTVSGGGASNVGLLVGFNWY